MTRHLLLLCLLLGAGLASAHIDADTFCEKGEKKMDFLAEEELVIQLTQMAWAKVLENNATADGSEPPCGEEFANVMPLAACSKELGDALQYRLGMEVSCPESPAPTYLVFTATPPQDDSDMGFHLTLPEVVLLPEY